MVEPITTTLLAAFFLKGAASGLGQVLGQVTGETIFSAGKSLLSRFTGIRASGLPQKVQEDSRYQEAMAAYFKRDVQLREQELQAQQKFNQQLLELKEQELQARQEFNRSLLELLAEWQGNTNQNKLTEIQNDWDRDNWFSKLDRRETEQILGQARHRLLILAANPDISQDCPPSFEHNLRTDIRNGASRFVGQHYSLTTAPVEFYGDYFKEPISDIDVRRLHTVLGTVPTVIIYTDITDYQANFHIGFWGIRNDSIAQFSLPVWNWEQAYLELTRGGQTEEKQALRQIRQVIVQVHQLLAGFVADWYYLHINPFYDPQLFELESEFPVEWITPFIEQLQEPYRLNQAGICYERGLRLTELERYQEAVESFTKALGFKPEFEEAKQRRELLLEKLGKAEYEKGLQLADANHYGEAVASFDKALVFQPYLEQAWFNRGLALVMLNRLEEAIASFDKAREIRPESDEIRAIRSFCAAIKSINFIVHSKLNSLHHKEQALTPKQELRSLKESIDFLKLGSKYIKQFFLNKLNVGNDLNNDLNKLNVDKNFQLIVGGRFKGGKSTLLNALLGPSTCQVSGLIAEQGPLPVDTLPYTDVLTRINYSETPRLRVWHFDGTYEDGDRFFKDSFKDISEFELFYPAELCQSGVIAIDTPGIFEGMDAQRTEIAGLVAKECDVAIVVYPSHSFGGEREINFAEEIMDSGTRVLQVVNLWDCGSSIDLERLKGFVWNRLITDRGRPKYEGQDLSYADIYFVNANKALIGRMTRNEALIKESGLENLMNRIDSLHEKCSTIRLSKVIINFKSIMRKIEDKLILTKRYFNDIKSSKNESLEHLKYLHNLFGDRIKGISGIPLRIRMICDEFYRDVLYHFEPLIHDFNRLKQEEKPTIQTVDKIIERITDQLKDSLENTEKITGGLLDLEVEKIIEKIDLRPENLENVDELKTLKNKLKEISQVLEKHLLEQVNKEFILIQNMIQEKQIEIEELSEQMTINSQMYRTINYLQRTLSELNVQMGQMF